MAIVTLVDESRQWFKARVGVGVAETPRDVAFCAHAIMGTDVFEVPDAALDLRFAKNPLVTGEPHLRFYASVPLICSDACAIGTLAVLDDRPHKLSDSARDVLKALGRQVVALLETRREEPTDVQAVISAADREFEASRRRFRTIFDESPHGMALLSTDGYFERVNETLCTLLGRGEGELIGCSLDEFGRPETVSAMAARYGSLLADEFDAFESDEQLLRPDGEIVHAAVHLAPIRGEDSAIDSILMQVRDVSDSRALEVQVRQLQKLESIGQLAAGVAHDFNNLLTVIQVQASTIVYDHAGDESVTEMVVPITNAAERAADLTRQLLLFGGRQSMAASDFDVALLVEELLCMLRRIVPEKVDLVFEPADRKLPVYADAGMIEQVVTNLVVNAQDAMPNGGRLTVSVRFVEVDTDAAARHAEAEPGPYACVEVRDQGVGISPDDLQRVFEPFFTTKEVGEGSGLGLSTAFGILKDHDGWLDIESALGDGTVARAFLPLRASTSENGYSNAEHFDVQGALSGVVLLVEDEESVRRLTASIMRGAGLEVFEANSGPAALEIWEQEHGRIDLLLTDMVMPSGMSGAALAQRLRADRDDLSVVVFSGYSTEGPVPGIDAFVQKPFGRARLLQVLQSALATRASE